jgi:hypothetical protein
VWKKNINKYFFGQLFFPSVKEVNEDFHGALHKLKAISSGILEGAPNTA